MDRNYLGGKDSQNMTSMYYSSSNQLQNQDNIQAPSEINLRNKLNNAFSDLESLRKSLKNIRSNKNNSMSGNNSDQINKNIQKYDFFSDDRYNNVLSQIKHSNQEMSKNSKLTSSSRDKPASNNSFSIYKMQKETIKEEKSKLYVLFIFFISFSLMIPFLP